jgi:amidohydrolase
MQSSRLTSAFHRSSSIARKLFLLFLALVAVCCNRPVNAQAVDPEVLRKWVQEQLPELMKVYVHLHSHPEVSFEEKQTAAYLAGAWKKLGYEVSEGVGGHGIVGVLRNGTGSTVMLRTDLDALPVTEQTGLPFASKQTVVAAGGSTSGVMHACGHDIHMTNLLGVAQYMAAYQQKWKGTLVIIGQPAEERGSGAKAMLDEGLFKRFPRPDFALALHCESTTPTGKIAVSPGYSLANVDSVDIEVKGKGGHGAEPSTTVDPIVQAAELILSLQTIVSREIKPIEPAVITVGSIHGGSKHNIIGDKCMLQLTVRSYKPDVREKMLAAIKRKALAVAKAYDAPEPTITVFESVPALQNDAAMTERVRKSFQMALGTENVLAMEPVMGGEDFSQFGLAGVPIVMYRLGVISPERLTRFQQLNQNPPSLHSPAFYPDAREALETGIVSMTSATLDLLR